MHIFGEVGGLVGGGGGGGGGWGFGFGFVRRWESGWMEVAGGFEGIRRGSEGVPRSDFERWRCLMEICLGME